MRYTIMVSLLLLLASCGDNEFTSPTPPPAPPPPTTSIPPPPDPFNPGAQFRLVGTRGMLVFAGTQASSGEIQDLWARTVAANWPTVTWHVCSEVSRWAAQGAPLASGPPENSDENIENLIRFLDTAADLNTQVLLDVFCTIRDARPSSITDQELLEYAQRIALIANEYNHVAIHVSNEWWHGGSRLKENAMMDRAYNVINAHFDGLISSDQNMTRNNKRERFDTRGGRLEWADWHPFRNPDPTARDLEIIAGVNPGAWISEPTAYDPDAPKNPRRDLCCTANKQQIMDYMHNAERVGLIWTHHSRCPGLLWPQLCASPDWIPGEPF